MSEDLSDLDALFDEISSQRLGVNDAASVEEDRAIPVSDAVLEIADEALTAPHSGVAEPENADKPMFERLGGIVRLLHDSLRELGYDRSLSDVASQIGDAQGRLEYVATLT